MIVVVEVRAGRPVTVNASRRMHWRRRAEEDAMWRMAAKVSCLQQVGRVRFTGRVCITALPITAVTWYEQDPGGCYPSVKAAVDGLVDARLMVGDTGAHVAWIKMRPPEVRDWEGLELTIEPEGHDETTAVQDDRGRQPAGGRRRSMDGHPSSGPAAGLSGRHLRSIR